MKTILVPVDFSRATDAVVAQAVDLAEAVSARVVLLHIILPPVMVAEYGALMGRIDEIRVAGEKAAGVMLERLQKTCERRGLTVDTRQFTGSVVALIAEQAKTLGADFIVIGSHGHTALYDLFVGSTTHGVLRRAPCPVLVVPPAKRTPVRKARKKK
ncbi:MAG: universal stress protein [Opitutaceae bacterium]|nr:universal stress protein [Opitutaceae bacterium]